MRLLNECKAYIQKQQRAIEIAKRVSIRSTYNKVPSKSKTKPLACDKYFSSFIDSTHSILALFLCSFD